MSMQDPIADMLTRIRNGLQVRHTTVNVKASKVCEGICGVLKEQGYIRDYKRIDDSRQGQIRVYLKYGPMGEDVITEIQRVSKPGRRTYAGSKELPSPMGGLGVAIVSTSRGIYSDKQCREENVGGEVLCTVC
jgi:small subunit ribosomal protein S8